MYVYTYVHIYIMILTLKKFNKYCNANFFPFSELPKITVYFSQNLATSLNTRSTAFSLTMPKINFKKISWLQIDLKTFNFKYYQYYLLLHIF